MGRQVDAERFAELQQEVQRALAASAAREGAASEEEEVAVQIMTALQAAISAMAGWSLSVNRWQRRTITTNNALMERNRQYVLEQGGTEGTDMTPVQLPPDLEAMCRMPQQQGGASACSSPRSSCPQLSPGRGKQPGGSTSASASPSLRPSRIIVDALDPSLAPEPSSPSMSSVWAALTGRGSMSGRQVAPAPASAADLQPLSRSISPSGLSFSRDGVGSSSRMARWPSMDGSSQAWSPSGEASAYMRAGTNLSAFSVDNSSKGRRNSWAAGQDAAAGAVPRSPRAAAAGVMEGAVRSSSGSFSSRMSNAWVEEWASAGSAASPGAAAGQQLDRLPSVTGRAPVGRLAPMSRMVQGFGELLRSGSLSRSRRNSSVVPLPEPGQPSASTPFAPMQ